MIRSFRCTDTEKVFRGVRSRKFQAIEKPAMRRLFQLDSAKTLLDLRALEALTNDRAGQYSIRVNDRYRVCFVWNNGDAEAVEIVDYH